MPRGTSFCRFDGKCRDIDIVNTSKQAAQKQETVCTSIRPMKSKRSDTLSRCINGQLQKKLKFPRVVDPGNPFFSAAVLAFFGSFSVVAFGAIALDRFIVCHFVIGSVSSR